MTRDDVIRMAWDASVWIPMGSEREKCVDTLQRFATLIAATEREACAQLVEKNADVCCPNTMLCDVLRGNAAAIRARCCDAT